ncbi:site-specific DNA-methyltransferase [Sphingomonas sp. AOB5]|uniref:site-specific DNA-methyltransferase n=1 Tax=Sphingomonas sp. AOB5 TaxID=3034017 RepID=UPI0023F74868|nr:DNA methyltransferase [Sphingomonas sp. AOB5]MDF7773672.1 site-specific DNA-methyltransferase [Sphingomonas sp. AOB5]
MYDVKLEVVEWDIGVLVPHPTNARTHPRRQIEQLKASIRRHDFVNPILIDENGIIIAGHGRVQAARELGMTRVPAIVLRHLSEAQKRALRLADNKISLNSSWDPDLLRIELAELSAMEIEIDFNDLGFSEGEVNVILDPGADPDDEVIPALPTQPKTQLGDIWQLGDHRIGCGDGRDLAFVQQVLGNGIQADCAFLDAPYNVKIQGHANVKSKHREFAMASGEMTDSGFRDFLADTFGVCVKLSRDGAVHFLCMDWRHADDVSAVAKVLYGEQLNLCIWNKSNAGMGSLYRSKHELVFVYRVGDVPHLNTVELGRHGRNRTNVWDYASVNTFKGTRDDLDLHPTVKPVAMVADAIQDVTRRGDVVLDIFLGSGTTLIASERTGRRFRGLDIDPAYVDLAVDRWVAMTNGTPRLLKGWDI